MDKNELIHALKLYMLENEIGYIEIIASTNIDRTNILINIHEETEDDIEGQGYQTNYTC